RPIMMTTMAAILGGIPLALGTGPGSELRRPLGITIIGGLIVSQAMTLFTTPVVYLFFDGMKHRLGRATDKWGPISFPDAPCTAAQSAGNRVLLLLATSTDYAAAVKR